ncbi:hypothetical protein JY651_04355 [Pyxidicoccus parkwayensis]|uniref:Uncharacterized protein n=1 Tax=Pyxidicoccus parkwayensis TaxID=2813578 RepID=A0ABX7NZD5_9BACT|nr:hypothetical protein [Pyxidicoccus parkwaysis]QSQ24209.1 hypothetical protein JY651_04355 [Pyxidicoccus parkwaysis]
MSYGRRPRGPIGGVKGIRRVEGADAVPRIHAPERVSGVAAIEAREAGRRSFSEALERVERGLHSGEPLPAPAQRRALPAAPRREDEEEAMTAPEPLPESFIGLLWWKVKGRLP